MIRLTENTCRAPSQQKKEKATSYKAPAWSDLAYLYEAEAKKRLAAAVKSRGPRKSKLVPNLVIVDDELIHEEVDEVDRNGGIDGLYGDAPLSDDEDDFAPNQLGDEQQVEEIARLAEKGSKQPVRCVSSSDCFFCLLFCYNV